jgi:gliding motility-associated-like protein
MELQPHTINDIVKAIQSSTGPISIGGGRFSMGGQIGYENSLHLDMREFNKVIKLDKQKKQVTVQSGMVWRDLQKVIDKENLSVFTQKLPDQYFNINWSNASTSSTMIIDSAGTFWYTAMDSNNCIVTDTFKVITSVTPEIETLSNKFSCAPIMIKKTNKENYLTSNQMQVDSTLFIIESGEYVIKEENKCGYDEMSFNVLFANDAIYPNVITPNNYGKNDVLRFGAEHYTGLHLDIYNRWGEIIYKRKEYENTWDAFDISDGVYYYILQVEGCPLVKSWLNVVR